MPTTGLPYDLLPAGLVAQNRRQAAVLTLLTQIAWVAAPGYPVREPYAEWSWQAGTPPCGASLLPPLALVLWRGQAGSDGAGRASGLLRGRPTSRFRPRQTSPTR